MGNNLKKITEIILKTDLDLSDQIDLIYLFSKAEDEQLVPIFELFKEDSDWIKKINANYKAKQISLVLDAPDILRNIIKEEKKELEHFQSATNH